MLNYGLAKKVKAQFALPIIILLRIDSKQLMVHTSYNSNVDGIKMSFHTLIWRTKLCHILSKKRSVLNDSAMQSSNPPMHGLTSVPNAKFVQVELVEPNFVERE